MEASHFSLLPKLDSWLMTDSFSENFALCTVQCPAPRFLLCAWCSLAHRTHFLAWYWQGVLCRAFQCKLELWACYSFQGWDVLSLSLRNCLVGAALDGGRTWLGRVVIKIQQEEVILSRTSS